MAAVLSTTLAGGGALIAAVAGFGHRFRLWRHLAAFKIFFLGVVAATAGLAVGLIGAYLGWRDSQPMAVTWSVVACVVALAVMVPTLWAIRLLRKFPLIHDITTDTDDPPEFVAVRRLRADAPNASDYGGLEVARLQRDAYPDLKPMYLRMSPSEAFESAKKCAHEMGWEIVDADPAVGRIEASDRTFWFGFIDDIVIRIVSEENGSRIDVRSVSRVGRSDLGANAQRIRRFLSRL